MEKTETEAFIEDMKNSYTEEHHKLRDTFAGLAMQGQLASQGTDYAIVPNMYDELADKCYKLADAMMKVRKKR